MEGSVASAGEYVCNVDVVPEALRPADGQEASLEVHNDVAERISFFRSACAEAGIRPRIADGDREGLLVVTVPQDDMQKLLSVKRLMGIYRMQGLLSEPARNLSA